MTKASIKSKKAQLEKLLDGKDLNELPRDKYLEVFDFLMGAIWSSCNMPSVGDIADFVENKPNKTMEQIIGFLDNEEKLRELVDKESSIYTNEESDKFIEKVISSNVTDISASGYFYKKLISSCDDIKVIKDDCGSEGQEYFAEEITEEFFHYRIRFSYIVELKGYCKMSFKEFANWMADKKLEIIHVRTPMTCNEAPGRKLCAKCAGAIKKNDTEYFIPKDFGLFSTLLVTEHATQGSLDSMNKGKSENINFILERKPVSKKMSWEEVQLFAEEIVEEIGMIGVQSRFYEVSLMSRFYEADGMYSYSSLQNSFKKQGDNFGIFAYAPTYTNFIKLISSPTFEATSTKSQIAFDMYQKRENFKVE